MGRPRVPEGERVERVACHLKASQVRALEQEAKRRGGGVTAPRLASEWLARVVDAKLGAIAATKAKPAVEAKRAAPSFPKGRDGCASPEELAASLEQ